MGLKKRPAAGTVVRLTGKFLAQTGQHVGGEGQSRWKVIEHDCGLCAGGNFAAVNEPIDDETRRTMYGDIPADVPLWRHFALANLEAVGAPPKAEDQSDALGPIKRPLGP